MWHVVVRIDGTRYKRSLETKVESKAKFRRDEIQETLDLIKRGRLQIPPEYSAIDFVLANGDVEKLQAKALEQTNKTQPVSLDALFEQFFDSLPGVRKGRTLLWVSTSQGFFGLFLLA